MPATHTVNDDRPLIAIDAGQTGIRMRYTTPETVDEAEAGGIDPARDAQLQIEQVLPEVCAARGWRPAAAAIGLSGLAPGDARPERLLHAWREIGRAHV